MFNIIQSGKGALIGGLEWIPIDALDSAPSDVKEAISRRKARSDGDDGEYSQPQLSARYTTCDTRQGACVAGCVPLFKGVKIPKHAISLAARCARLAQERKTQDAVFGWYDKSGHINLIGIRNGLPVYDAVLTQSTFKVELPVVLSMFEMGCTTFGDESLFIPPVVPLGIEDIAAASTDGVLKTAGLPQWAQAVILVCTISVIGGYFAFEQAKKADRIAAERAEHTGRAAQKQPSPGELFAKAQSDALSSVPGCLDTAKPIGKMRELHSLIRGYGLSVVTADCQTGIVSAAYRSGYPADLSVRQADSRVRLTETLVDASIGSSFDARPSALSPKNMLPWQDWLVAAGRVKQRLQIVGIALDLGGAAQVVAGDPKGAAGLPVVIKGKLTLAGPAQYMREASGLIDNVVWSKITIKNDMGSFTFNMTGDYYAIKD